MNSINNFFQCNDFWHKVKMDNFDPYNVLLAIATNTPQRLKTGFVLQDHMKKKPPKKQNCSVIYAWKAKSLCFESLQPEQWNILKDSAWHHYVGLTKLLLSVTSWPWVTVSLQNPQPETKTSKHNSYTRIYFETNG